MKITDAASAEIQEALKSSNCTGIRLSLQTSCCGTSLRFEPIQDGESNCDTINGISVAMDAATKEWTENVTIDLANGKLMLQREGGCCG